MPSSALVQLFWSKVWQCTHRHPCKRCCWPWKAFEPFLNWKTLWHKHAACALRLDGETLIGPAHRCAYELQHGPVPFRGHQFHFCHQCHFAPCCNPWHVLPGSASDNGSDRRRLGKNRLPIRLPNGQLWDYAVACLNETYFTEACQYRRVWAGPILKAYPGGERQLFSPPQRNTWPGVWPRKMLMVHQEMAEDDIAAVQTAVRNIAERYRISVEFLCYLALWTGEC